MFSDSQWSVSSGQTSELRLSVPAAFKIMLRSSFMSVTRRRDRRKLSAASGNKLSVNANNHRYGQGCAIGGVAGMPGMWVGGVPGESPMAGVPGISMSGVPGEPGV